ncbi:hypothetical protein MSG28_013892 [Choristoneura fumiferana]|uniref:Uncharacterized protein n=1 Tax=Choristoneura fumiferana TaxID=7141 RepID=A0ACC0K9X1_CHOFU|nr:hypothetical protein MSG28_013892 [Choristoneura fumiferana]
MEKPEKDKPYSVIIFSNENNEYSNAINFNIPPEADWITYRHSHNRTCSKTCSHSHRFMLQLIYAAGFRTNLKEAFAVEKPRQAASSSSDKRKITKSKKYRDDSLSSPPSLPMKPIEEELNEIHAAMSKLVLNVAADSL